MTQYAYDYREPEGWAAAVGNFEQQLVDDGESVLLGGGCPRCQHYMDVELPIKAQTGSFVTKARDEEELTSKFSKIAHCNCQMPHKGRPETVTEGCGAFGRLDVG